MDYTFDPLVWCVSLFFQVLLMTYWIVLQLCFFMETFKF